MTRTNVKFGVGLLGFFVTLQAGCVIDGTTSGGAPDPASHLDTLTDSRGKPLSALAQRIVAANQASDRDMNLVARLEVQPGELLEFYEVAPGRIMLSGAGAPTGGVIFTGDRGTPRTALDVANLWQFAAGSVAMPQALSEALARLDRHRPHSLPVAAMPRPMATRSGDDATAAVDTKTSDQQPLPDNTGVQESAVAGGWCQTSYFTVAIKDFYPYAPLGYCPNNSYWTFVNCWDHVTGDGWASHGDAGFMNSNVCPYRGQVIFKVEADESWIQTGSWTVPENTYRWKSTEDTGCDSGFNDCPWIKTSVLNASGDGYNYRFLVSDF